MYIKSHKNIQWDSWTNDEEKFRKLQKFSTEIWTMENNCWIWKIFPLKKMMWWCKALLVSHLIVVFCDIKSHPSCSASTKVNFSVTFTAILFTLGKFFLTPSSCCLYHIFSFIGCQESWLRKIIAHSDITFKDLSSLASFSGSYLHDDR